MDYMGNHPCIFTEIGIPYDMDDKYAYKTGDYSSQSSAMDANHFALEGCGCNGYALWLYMATVCPMILRISFLQWLTLLEQSCMGRPLEWRRPFNFFARRQTSTSPSGT